MIGTNEAPFHSTRLLRSGLMSDMSGFRQQGSTQLLGPCLLASSTRSGESPSSHLSSGDRTRLAAPGTTCRLGRSSRATEVPRGRVAGLPELVELPQEPPERTFSCTKGYSESEDGNCSILHKGSLESAALDFLKPRLMQSCTAIAVPLHYCVFFIRPFNSAQFSRRLPEIAQTLDAISGIYFQLLWRRLDEWWPLGSVCISRCSSVRQWWLRSLAQFGRRIGSVHWFHEEKATPFICPHHTA